MATHSQKVLIVDDSVAIHALVKARLADANLEFHSAFGGTEGIELAKQIEPDVILLDVDMPEMNGLEVCKRLKGIAQISHIPVIFLTGASAVSEKVAGLKLGAVDYVVKPFEPAELAARVGASLRTKFMLDLLSKKAQIDGLTGVYNRAYLEDRLKEVSGRAKSTGGEYAVVMVDADHFKSVNDRFGHPFGDHVLRCIANALSHHCGPEGTVCRYGGEEFVVLYAGIGGREAAMRAEGLRMVIQSIPLTYKGEVVKISASFGVAGQEAEPTVVDAADGALYQSKQGGRNRVTLAGAVSCAASKAA